MRSTLVAIALAALALPSAASAETITVTTTADVSATECTLRDAIVAANTNVVEGGCHSGSPSGVDVIDFAVPSGSTIALGSPLPPISTAVDVNGPGAAALTVSGGAGRAFETTADPVSISDLTIADSHCGFGCGIDNDGTLKLTRVTLRGNEASVEGGTNAFPSGGAIYNGGSLQLIESVVAENTSRAAAATGQNSPEGGGITNHGTEMLIDRSTIRDNDVIAAALPAATSNANGGGIANFGKLIVRRSTLSGNTASGSGSVTANRGNGGAISNANGPAVKVAIDRTTIVGNTATATVPVSAASGGGFTAEGGSFEISGSTVAGNSAPAGANAYLAVSPAKFRDTIVAQPLGGGQSCEGVATDSAFNLDEGTSCGFVEPSDRSGVDPMLDPAGLADNGGPTRTIALLSGSPAIDKGLSQPGETTDQRTLLRPVQIPDVPDAPGGDGTDIGAYEVQLPPVPPGGGPGTGSSSKAVPQTKISALPGKTTKRRLKIRFSSSQPGSSFKCKLDGKPWRSCRSPYKTPKLAFGKHTFRVRAIGPGGVADPTPAKRTFRVLPPGG